MRRLVGAALALLTLGAVTVLVEHSASAAAGPGTNYAVDDPFTRWTGMVQARFSGPQTFVTVSDETVQVWIDGKLVINHSTPHGPAVDTATVNLVAGRKYTIRVDYTEHTGEAYLKLLWYNADSPQQIVPSSRLYPAT